MRKPPRRPTVLLALLLTGCTSVRQEHDRLDERVGCLRVLDAIRTGYGSTERIDTWVYSGFAFHCRARTMRDDEVAEIRRVVMAAPTRVDDLLATVGITPRTLAAHRDDVLAASLPRAWKENGGLPTLSPELERLLSYDNMRATIENELVGANHKGKGDNELEVVLPGDPEIIVRSSGPAPWMLPWEIEAGGRTWWSPDVRVSKALLPLVAPDGACAGLLDGEAYWTEDFYRDEDFWRHWIGPELDAALPSETVTILADGTVWVNEEKYYDPSEDDGYSRFIHYLASVESTRSPDESEGQSGDTGPEESLLVRVDQSTAAKYIQGVLIACKKSRFRLWDLQLLPVEEIRGIK